LAMLLLGSRLVRLACGLMGLVLGAAAGVAGAAIVGTDQWVTLGLVVVAGLVGVVVSIVLFRVWASVSAGLVMGITAAVAGGWLMQPDVVTLGGSSGGGTGGAALVAESAGPSIDDILTAPDAEARERVEEAAGALLDRATAEARERLGNATDAVSDAIRDRIDGVGADGEPAADKAEGAEGFVGDDELQATERIGIDLDAEEVADDLLTALDEMKSAAFAWVGALWGGLDNRSRMVVVGAGAIAGGVALVFGAVLPTATVTVAAAWLGACVIGLAGGTLLRVIWPGSEAYLPSGAAGQLAVVGLITLVGLGLQWTLGRRKADD
ncbi:MAG: hypothetical protein AAF842_12505, partial [Planctomycetota bacterium]